MGKVFFSAHFLFFLLKYSVKENINNGLVFSSMKGCLSTVGRRYEEESIQDDPFLEDFFRITRSLSYARLADKSQVIPSVYNTYLDSLKISNF